MITFDGAQNNRSPTGDYLVLLCHNLLTTLSYIQSKKTMNKETLIFFTRIILSVFISITVSTIALAHPSGAPAGYTGSPGDTHHCQSCHGGSVATVANWITSNIPATGYVAGTVYTITATVTGTGKKGFEVSPQNGSGTQLGILAAGTGSKLVGGTKYVTQSSAGATTGTKIWNFSWTAPSAGTGPVTFYGAFTVGEPNTKLSTMIVQENAVIPLTATASATPGLICAGQSTQLNVIPAGGSGSYTYSWTSIPAGFTSSIQNPVVSPVVSTQYTANVSDGTNSVNAPTNVTVNQPVTANAGIDTTCAFEITQVPLNGLAASYSSVLWTTAGSGTFSAAGSLTGYYFPSTTDKNGMNVTLTLTAIPVSPCAANATDTRIVHFDFPTGIPDTKSTNPGMVVSPNPSHGLFTIHASGLDNINATVTISDITGRTIFQRILPSSEIGQEKFDLTGHPKGLYLVRVQTETESTVRKLIVE